MMLTRTTRRRLAHAPLRSLALFFALTIFFVPQLITSAERARATTESRRGVDQPVTTPTSPTPYYVQFPFLVVDESGRSVSDVRREDVSLTDNGAPQTIAELKRDETPVSYGLVIDNSGSVRPILDLLVRSGGSLVSANRPADETFVMRFVDVAHMEILEDFTSSQQELTDALSDMYVQGGQTAVIDALYGAAQHVANRNADHTRRLALVLVTDGEERGSSHKPEELFELLRREQIQVFVIGLTALLDDTSGFIRKSSRANAVELLEAVAGASGGRAFFPGFGKKRANDLNEAIKEITSNLQAEFSVSYAPPPEAADGRFHKVQIKVAEGAGKGKRKVVAAPGYFAPGGAKQTGKE
jgi:VWFA-related protein